MNNNKLLLVLLPLVLWGLACQKDQPLQAVAYKTYVEDTRSGLWQSHRQAGVRYTARYLPARYQALKAFNFQVRDSLAFFETLAEMEGHHYLLLQLEAEQVGGSLQKIYEQGAKKESWSAVKNDWHFHFQKQFQLWVAEEAKACKLYHAFSGIDPSKSQYFMLVFKDEHFTASTPFEGDLVLEFKDTHLAGTTIQLHFEQEQLNGLPELQIMSTYEN